MRDIRYPMVPGEWGIKPIAEGGKQYGVALTDTELKRLVKKGDTGEIDRFVSKKTGNAYTARLVLKEDRTVGIEFPER